jgi:hypothetical protein
MIQPEQGPYSVDTVPSLFEQITPRDTQLRDSANANLWSTEAKADKYKKHRQSQASLSFYSEVEHSKRTSAKR